MGNYKTKELLDFKSGDFVVDNESNEIGLLVMRFNLLESQTYDYPIWAWDILWSGHRNSYNKSKPRKTPYTEESLKNMVIEGVLSFYKNN